MKVIILAAGFGSRMYPLTQDTPKALLNIGKEPAIKRQIRQLNNFGIHDISVVLGFKANQFKTILNKDIKIYYSAHYQTTGSLYSLWTAREEINDQLYILNSDLVFADRFLKEIKNNFPVATTIAKVDFRNIDVKVKVKNGHIIEVNKNLQKKDSFGEATDCLTVSKKGCSLLIKRLKQMLENDTKNNMWNLKNHLAKNKELDYKIITSYHREFDTAQDYQQIQNYVEKNAI